MSHRFQFDRITKNSNSKNKIIMLKNIRGMNDPAFQSNNTLKQYINKKLTLYEGHETGKYIKTKTFLKFNEKKKISNRNHKNNRNFAFTEYSFYSKDHIHNLSHCNNSSLNNLKKIKQKIKERNRNNFYIFRCNNGSSKNKSLNKKLVHKNKKGLNIEENNYNKYFEMVLTPNNNFKKENNKTTPVNASNKIKGIYRHKNIFLNKSFKSFNRGKTSLIKKEKRKEYKSPENFSKMKLNQEKYNIMQHKPLNQTYFKDYSNKSRHYKDNLTGYFQSENNDYNDKLKEALLKDESLNESECPEPMPYVIKYSEIMNKENISNSTLNIINNFNNNLKDLNEPKEEKNIPLPVSQINNRNNKFGNNNRKFIYMNKKKFVKNEN